MLTVNIKKNLGAFQLDVAFETDGEIMGLLGASGCGKSMTLKCVAGIETPDEGRIVLGDRVLFDSEKKINLPPQKRRVGYLFQQYALFPNMSVEQNIAAGCREKDKAKKEQEVAQKISEMRLNGLEKKRPALLSGGQQRRVALARILINQPELLLLDEPFTALDSYLKWQLEIEVADIIREYGRGAIFVSHSRDEIYRLCDSVCVLFEGSSERKQPVKTLFSAPETYSASLISGCKNYSRAQLSGDAEAFAEEWGVTLRLEKQPGFRPAYLGIRSHFIELAEEEVGENTFPCTVERVIDDVFSAVVMLRPDGGSALLRAEGDKEVWGRLTVGEIVYVRLPASQLMPLKE